MSSHVAPPVEGTMTGDEVKAAGGVAVRPEDRESSVTAPLDPQSSAFIDAIGSGKKPSPSGEDGLNAQRLADAATESAKTGQPVKV